jgi:hypothetical protein
MVADRAGSHAVCDNGMVAIDCAPPSGKKMWARDRPIAITVSNINTHFAIGAPQYRFVIG